MTDVNILHAMGRIDPRLIAGAAPHAAPEEGASGPVHDDPGSGAAFKRGKNRIGRGRWGVLAACFCLAAVGALALWKDTAHRPAPDLEKISIPELAANGMGFEGVSEHNASELDNGNPWNEKMTVTSLPVYRNKAFDPSLAGVPRGLTEEEMRSLLDAAASALGVEVISTDTIKEETRPLPDPAASAPGVTELHAVTDQGEIDVCADGSIVYYLPDGGLALPDGYSFTRSDTTDDEAREAVDYLSALYSDFLRMEAPVSVTWGQYSFRGEYFRNYAVYDACGDDREDILNYNLWGASFSPNQDGKLSAIRIDNALLTAEKIDDYPIISASEARRRLLAGNYQTSAPYAMPGKEYIAKVELMYRTGRLEEMLIPYYRFYVFLPDESENGLKTYGAYYVPAIAEEYIENMPVYDGRFN